MPDKKTRTDGPTPNGGAYAIAFWQDADGQPTSQELATRAEVVEYDEQDQPIFRSYLQGNALPQRSKLDD